MSRKKTHEQFIIQANYLHNNKYQYPNKYIADDIKLDIVCPYHGIFAQIPSSHLQGCGCPKCAKEHLSNLFRKTHSLFIEKANLIHQNKYQYFEQYSGAKKKITITCYIHGSFTQTPDKHLQGNGCPKCAGRVRKAKEQFVDEANIVHNYKYTYPGKYVNARTNIEIECIKHGIFMQVPDVHLNGCGCPHCASNSSKMEAQWLDSIGLPNDAQYRQARIKIGQSYIKPDGFDPNTNTIYEFYGDYFHGNPAVYSPDKINHKNKKTFGELFKKTKEREDLIMRAGYNLVYMWENDWKSK
jgi:hypothetical protein